MADLITTKAAFPKSGGLAVANGAVSVNAGNGLHVNPTTGMVEVPVDTTAGLGYGSNGLEVEVDDSTIGFNASGQLQALGGGGGDALKPFYLLPRLTSDAVTTVGVGNWQLKTSSTRCALQRVNGFVSTNILIITGIHLYVTNSTNQVLYVMNTDNFYPYGAANNYGSECVYHIGSSNLAGTAVATNLISNSTPEGAKSTSVVVNNQYATSGFPTYFSCLCCLAFVIKE